MPGMNCACGHRIFYGEIPCPHQWLFISDADYDSFSGTVDAEAVYSAMNSFLKCEACGRLWVFWNGFRSAPEEYLPGGGSLEKGAFEPGDGST